MTYSTFFFCFLEIEVKQPGDLFTNSSRPRSGELLSIFRIFCIAVKYKWPNVDFQSWSQDRNVLEPTVKISIWSLVFNCTTKNMLGTRSTWILAWSTCCQAGEEGEPVGLNIAHNAPSAICFVECVQYCAIIALYYKTSCIRSKTCIKAMPMNKMVKYILLVHIHECLDQCGISKSIYTKVWKIQRFV